MTDPALACGFCAMTAGAFRHIHDGYHISKSVSSRASETVPNDETEGVPVNPNSKQRDPEKRVFVESIAEFLGTSLLLGCVGPSSCGKTFSALALARGIQRVSGGHITVIDTEAGRAKMYAKRFQFKLPDGRDGLRHIPFSPPFSPLDYLAAIEQAVKNGAKVIVVDSMSHEHEGEGGVLEMHEEDMGGDDKKQFTAWARPKAQRRQLIGRILQFSGVHFIFCFRAKEKLRYSNGKPEIRGLMPQAGEEFIYEMTMNFLLPLGANGVPVLSSTYEDEQIMIKIPEQFLPLFREPRQLSADLGQHLAMWAAGSSLPAGMVAPKLVRAPDKPGTVPAPVAAAPATPAAPAASATPAAATPLATAPPAATPPTAPASAAAPAPAASTQYIPAAAGIGIGAGLQPLIPSAATNVVGPVQGTLVTVADIIAMYGAAKTREEMKGLRPQYNAVFATASAEDRSRMAAAGNAAADRIAAPAMTPVDAIISLYDRAPTREIVRELRPQFDAVYDTASEADRARMNAAGRTAIERLVAAEKVAAENGAAQPQPQPQVTPPQATPAAPAAAAAVDAALEATRKRNADGMDAFRNALNSLGAEITQEQAAQLVIDHMSEDAKDPKVGTEDGTTAQAEIMARTVPKFPAKASLGVMVRHVTYCAKYKVYKTYCDDLLLCKTAQNVYECWALNGKLVDSLPDEVKKEARLRTGKRIEVVDEKISQGGVWLTKRIKEAREAAGGSTTGTSAPPAVDTPAAAAASTNGTPAVGTPAAAVSTPAGNGSADVHEHAPIESDLGQRLALEIDGATVETILDIKPRLERYRDQKKLPAADIETLFSLHGEKVQALASA